MMGKKKDAPAQPSFNAWMERLKDAGFEAVEWEAGQFLISKHGCGAVVERSASGEPRFVVRPGLRMGEGVACLVDRGFQKFWQDGQRMVPALADQLKALHRFDQDWRAAMGLTSLYNEALGTVSTRYIYDRLEGREGSKKHKPFG